MSPSSSGVVAIVVVICFSIRTQFTLSVAIDMGLDMWVAYLMM